MLARARVGVATIAAMDSLNKPLNVVEHCGGLDNRQVAECLGRVAAGDRVAFETLYRLTSARPFSTTSFSPAASFWIPLNMVRGAGV